MKMKTIVAGGSAYADIDVLACVAAYTQLLRLTNREADGIISAPWNQTIPQSIKLWPIQIENALTIPVEQCRFVLVDVSDPNFMEKFVTLESVIEVFDHHYGHELFWKQRLPHATTIDKVGSCATLIWEKFKEYGCESLISSVNANLLYTAIFSNTLNFKSHVTSERDVRASDELLHHVTLPNDWQGQYYAEVAQGLNQDLHKHICADTKTIFLENGQVYFGQIELLNASSIIAAFHMNFAPNSKEEWIVNIASIEENLSYLYINSSRLHQKMLHITAIEQISRHLYVAKRLWQRKELLRELLACSLH